LISVSQAGIIRTSPNERRTGDPTRERHGVGRPDPGGDPTAFDELVVKYSPRLYGLVYHMTSNHEDTNDLLQDIFSKAYRSVANFRGKSSFYTWMHSIAVNMTINFLKKRNRRQHPSLNDPDSRIENDPDFIAATSNGDPTKEVSIHELQKN